MAKKRSSGEGSIRKRDNGTWRGEVMAGYTTEGKKKIIRFSGATKGEVLDKIREFRNEQTSGLSVNKELTLREWADSWYEDYRSQVKPSTHAGYKNTLNQIKKRLGKRALCEILPMDINRMQDSLVAEGYSLSQISKCRAMLIQIFDAADNNGLIVRNAARKAKVIRDTDGSLSKPRMVKDAFTEEEIRLLRANLPDDLMGNGILTMIGSGVRVQELIALTPKDITEDGSTIRVDKAVEMVNGVPRLGPPKSKKSERTIPVPEAFRKNAKYLREHGGKEAVFTPEKREGPYSVGTFRRRYYKALKQVEGVRLLSPHCCRHTYVTRLQAKGVPFELIAQLAGHSDVNTTQVYTHTSIETLAKAVSVLR